MAINDRFDLLARVAGSSASTVWKARDRRLDRLVALKVLDSPTPERRAQWREEARRLAALEHPNIVMILGYEEDAEQAVIIEEWIEGATLSAVLRRTGALAPAQALGVIRGALLGLAYLHTRGLVHADVSPGNLLIDDAGSTRVVDLGLTAASGTIARPATGAYQAPEAVTGGLLTPASDVYAAAAVLAMLLRGSAVVSPTLDGVDPGLRPVLTTALAADPAARYPDAAAFLAALEDAASRRYGGAWWTQAGLGGAATAALAGVSRAVQTTAGVTATAVLGAQVVAGHRVEAAAYPYPAAAGAPAAAKACRRARIDRMATGTKVAIIGGVAAVAAAAVVTVAVTRGGSDESPTATRQLAATTTAAVAPATTSAAAPSTPTPTPTPSPVARTATYNYTSVVTAKDNPTPGGDEIGDTNTVQWTATGLCPESGPCDVTIRTAGGTLLPVGTGDKLVRDFTETGTCEVDSSPAPASGHQDLTIVRGADGMPQTLTGTVSESFPATASCSAVNYTYAITVTRVS